MSNNNRVRKMQITVSEIRQMEAEMANEKIKSVDSGDLPFGKLLPNSMVAVFDIMGFKSIIESNVQRGSLQMLCATLNSALTSARTEGLWEKYFPRSKNVTVKTVSKAQKEIKVYLFSDTMIIVKPEFKVRGKARVIDTLSFLEFVVGAYYEMFEKGFALRGCIDCGDCLRSDKNNFLLGVPFLQAMVSAESLDFVGLTLTDKAKRVMSLKILPHYGVRKISVRVRRGEMEDRYCLDWLKTTTKRGFCNREFKKRLEKVSKMHGKKINARVRNIIANTVNVMAELAKEGK